MGSITGITVMTARNKDNLPFGWLLCDGTNGTPDLREKFIRGAAVDAGGSGGTENHTHDFTGDGHSHDLESGNDIKAGIQLDDVVSEENVTGTTDAKDNLPEYFELIFLMKS